MGISALATKGGGGFTYLANLLTHFSRLPAPPECVVAAHSQVLARLRGKDRSFEAVPLDPRGLAHRIWLEQRTLPALFARRRVDVILAPNNVGPLWTEIPTVVTIQNVEPLVGLEGEMPWSYRLRLRGLGALTAMSLRRASAVIAVSGFARDLIRRRVRSDDRPVDVIPLGAPDDRETSPPAEGEQCRRALGVRSPYLLAVSAVKSTKNYPRLIEAFARAELPDVILVVAGGIEQSWAGRAVGEAIARHGVADRVRQVGYVEGPTLRALYDGALAVVMPSLLESFGLPALEAMAYGRPVAVARIPALLEVCGDGAAYFDPYDVTAISGVLRTVATDEGVRRHLAEAGRRRAEAFRWSEVARRTREALATAAERTTN
ncbi:MAG: glycosyltransferase family 1 protein [Armatimonadota bacterium]|nr:glycosyltransferase family 1 protein [Armatimonadota bacterium]MDR7452001.1 glycosyltransferase family 1 protein [Armatimonadota bacterium]MDR7467892.1 glycosyltransferase family 1 protein [Armatimonadota bacterium]MDR7494255.1 glycosyltransferase family 1 protein [Armatimonadota bacterium]MDR7500036.1 glycosyltransferase family 1 protein [Armatimonadota bacterium]